MSPFRLWGHEWGGGGRSSLWPQQVKVVKNSESGPAV